MIMFDFLTYTFMQRALLAGVLVGISTPLLGVFVVARRSSLITDTFAHVALAGVGLGLLLEWDPILSALGLSLLMSIGLERLMERSKVGVDALQAMFLSGGLALAVLFTSLKSSAGMGLDQYLFGSLLTVNVHELWILGICASTVFLTVWKLYPALLALSFNENLAHVGGFRVRRMKTIFGLLLAFTIALSLKIVGGLLIGALMVIPVLTAGQFAKSFKGTLFCSVGVSLISVVAGILISYFMDIPSGSSIVLINIVFFLLSSRFKF